VLASSRSRLRPVSDEDRAFLLELYGESRARELALVCWDERTKAAFVRQQFCAQDEHYRRHYEGASLAVVEVGGERAGRLYVFAGRVRSASSTSCSHRRSAGAGSAAGCCGG